MSTIEIPVIPEPILLAALALGLMCVAGTALLLGREVKQMRVRITLLEMLMQSSFPHFSLTDLTGQKQAMAQRITANLTDHITSCVASLTSKTKPS